MPNSYLEENQEHLYPVGSEPAHHQVTAKRNRYRLGIFGAVFILSALVGLSYTFMRPEVYQSTATLLIAAPAVASPVSANATAPAAPASSVDRTGGVTDAHQVAVMLTSQDLLAHLHERLVAAGMPRESLPDSVAGLHRRLEAIPFEDANMVELHTRGPQREQLPILLTTWIKLYLEAYADTEKTAAASTVTALQQQLQELEPKVAEKRRALEQFRQHHDIVSLQGDENQQLAQLKGLQESLSKAIDQEAIAKARLEASKTAIAQGETVLRSKDQTEISQLETQAAQLRSQLKQLGERFTPKYMTMDPEIVAMTTKLEQLTRQIADSRQQSQRLAVAEAEQALNKAQRTVVDLQRQLDTQKRTALTFTARFAEHKALQEALTQLEQLYQQTQTRLAQEEVAHQYNFPQVTVLSQPTLPDAPSYPNYPQDAGISLVASLLLGILAVGLYELLNRSPKPIATPSESRAYFYAIPENKRITLAEAEVLPAARPALEHQPRELSAAEVRLLLEVADQAGWLFIALLLSGLSVEEAAALRWEHVDLSADTLHVPGVNARALPLVGLLREELAAQAAEHPANSAPLLQQQGHLLTVDDLQALLTCLAHDAGLTEPDEVNPQQLRHTYLAFLVRQGARLTELERVAGHLPPTVLAAYRAFAPPDPARSLEQIEWVYPVLRI
jgi:uncharacterized protein involved in exopolysaccharide biosynthesis